MRVCDNMKSLFNHFEVLEAPRDVRGKRPIFDTFAKKYPSRPYKV